MQLTYFNLKKCSSAGSKIKERNKKTVTSIYTQNFTKAWFFNYIHVIGSYKEPIRYIEKNNQLAICGD